jgi:hypothetical protein
MAETQNFKNHTRWDPVYHFFTLPILLANIIVVGVVAARSYQTFGFATLWSILVAVALFFVALKARTYALRDQDRIIRLEERLRLASMIPAEQMAELESLTMRQYIGLRFASNPELPALARRAVREKLTEKQIKEAVVSWRADDCRV